MSKINQPKPDPVVGMRVKWADLSSTADERFHNFHHIDKYGNDNLTVHTAKRYPSDNEWRVTLSLNGEPIVVEQSKTYKYNLCCHWYYLCPLQETG